MVGLIDNTLVPGTEEFENLIHHLFCLYGITVAFVCGRFIGVVMNVSLLTEISTPFVNIWWLLSTHEMTSSKLYEINGYLMTITFFLGRIVFQTYLIICLLIPGAINIEMS